MPIRPKLNKLPPGVRTSLHRRLVAADFGDTVQIAEWLSARGYPVGKSTVAQYAAVNRAAIVASVAPRRWVAASRTTTAEVRLRCLEAALRSGQPGRAIQRADAYLAWVLQPAN